MNAPSDNHPDSLLEKATAMLRDSAPNDSPPQLLIEQTLDALGREERSKLQTRRWTMYRNKTLAAAAAVAIIGGAALFGVYQRPSGLAFGAVVQNVRASRAVSFTINGTSQLADQTSAPVHARVFVVEPSRMRQEIDGGKTVIIFDFSSGKQLWLTPSTKTAMFVHVAPTGDANAFNILDAFEKIDPNAFKPIAEREIAGRKVSGFRAADSFQTRTVWVDQKTRLPIEMEMKLTGSMSPKSEMTFSEFDWDPTVSDEMFSLEPPAGYQEQSASMDFSKPAEADLIAALRAIGELNDGALPDSLDMDGLMNATKAIAARVAGKHLDKPQAIQAEVMNQMAPIGRGMAFVAIQTDAHYAGGGAKLDEPDRAIFWYRPAGSDTYRVIDARLQVREAAPSSLPKVDSKPVGATTTPAR